MKRLSYSKLLAIILSSALFISGCKKEEEPIVPEEPVIKKVIPQASDVNLFVYYGLHDYYLWNYAVPALSDKKYEKADSLNFFLNKYTDPEMLFTSLLYKYEEIDKWSFIVDNSKTIDDWIAGISETMGYDFMLGRIGSSGNLFGFVRYVYKDSPAEAAGMKRGDIFLKVNDTQLSLTNYRELLLNTKTYKLSFATIANNSISDNGQSVTMTAVEMQENPINMDTVFVYNNQKIGYLVYNGFNSDFDIQLNNVFKKFKDANIDQLVVDLRYNGGGSVQSSIYLASMIYGPDESKVFAKSQYNAGLQAYLIDRYGDSALSDNLVRTIDATTENPMTLINTVNMRKVYFIVSDNTASASEMLINGLKPYMTVKVVGTNTNGKYTGSTTLKDLDENGKVNPSHDYAMQPIIVKYANSLGVSDFVDGLAPDIKAEEDFAALLPFGDPNEDLLSVVLADIKGMPVTGMTLKSAKIGLQKVADSRDFKPYAHEMYVNPEKIRGYKKIE